MMSSQAIRNWYEIDGNNNLIVWQGVCAIFIPHTSICELFKYHSNSLYSIQLVDVNFQKICSDGFWECAEITGELSNNQHILYHAPNADEAACLLKTVEQITENKIKKLTIRLDDDPLRLENAVWINERLAKWKQILRNYESGHLVIDKNMPM